MTDLISNDPQGPVTRWGDERWLTDRKLNMASIFYNGPAILGAGQGKPF